MQRQRQGAIWNTRLNTTEVETGDLPIASFSSDFSGALPGVARHLNQSPESLELSFDFLECKVCLLKFSEEDENLCPRILTSCGHTLCKTCIDRLRVQDFSFNENKIKCPFDRKTTILPRDNQLPKNFTIIEMIRDSKRQQSHVERPKKTEICENPDTPCFENQNHESTCYCTTCKVDFCESCFKSTHLSKVMSSHKAVPLADKPITVPTCAIHESLPANYICTDDSCQIATKLFCDLCQVVQHKSHAHVNLVEFMLENQKNLEKIVKNLKVLEISNGESIATILECEKSFEKTTSAYATKVASITKYFDDKKQEALKKLEKYVDSEKKKLISERHVISSGLELLTETRKEIEQILKRKTDLYDVEGVMEIGNTLCTIRSGSREMFHPFSPNSLPDDMSSTVQRPQSPPPPFPTHRNIQTPRH